MPSGGRKFILLAVDTAGIQSYVFGSNRLKENIGASYLVKQATEDWALEALKKAAPNNNLLNNGALFNDTVNIEDGALDAEVLYAGGGNFIALFREADAAREFTRRLSKKALTDAPGLRLDIYQELCEWTDTGLGEAVKHLLQGMKKARGKKRASAPLMGLGVTVMCQSTALPAVAVTWGTDGGERYVSAEVYAKEIAADQANAWLRSELPPGNGYTYPLDLDELGRSKGERSYVAVVHADGNGMGEIIRKIAEQQDNRTYIQEMRDLSEKVKAISKAAMQHVIDLLGQKTLEGICIPGTRTVSDLEFAWDGDRNLILPIRPIVFGGDDTTFVCDGRIGLALATEYLREFEEEAKTHGLDSLSACAGIAIVKSHYPFARAYQLSEDLCSGAKRFRRDKGYSGGALDWHFTSGGLYDELEEIRKREFAVSAGSLLLRPVSLGDEGAPHSWNEMERLTRAFQEEWADMRNKAKALRDALREGEQAVSRFLSIYEQTLPPLTGFEETGWNNEGRCGYFDALELMDIHTPLREKEVQP